MTGFTHDDLYQLLKDLTSKFVKKEVLDRCKNSSSLCKLDFHLEENHFNHPDLGFGADTVIKDRLKGLVSNLIQTKWNIPRNGDEINSEYKRYIEKVAFRKSWQLF